MNVLGALAFAVAGGTLAGFVGSIVFKKSVSKETKQADAQAVGDVQFQ